MCICSVDLYVGGWVCVCFFCPVLAHKYNNFYRIAPVEQVNVCVNVTRPRSIFARQKVSEKRTQMGTLLLLSHFANIFRWNVIKTEMANKTKYNC